jgi:transposase InsO family protein
MERPKSRRKYDADYKRQVLQMLEEGQPASKIAQSLGAGESLDPQRQPPPGLITHSDRGGQYTSARLRRLLHTYLCRQSMSRPDDPPATMLFASLFSVVSKPNCWKKALS